MKNYLIAIIGLGIMIAFSACNTLRGAGQDVQSLGHGIQRAANS